MSAPVMASAAATADAPVVVARPRTRLLRAVLRMWPARIGLAVVVVVVLIALAGPLVAPHSAVEFVGAPNSGPSGDALLGADSLGRDVLSRFLYGGRTILGLAVASTVIGVGLGLLVGLTAAYLGGLVDEILMRIVDVLLAFPQIVMVLLLVTAFGPEVWLLILTVGISHMPMVARTMRGAAQQVVERDFIKAADAVGESRRRIIVGELLPNVTSPLLVELALRLTWSIGLIAALNFLGLGLRPPSVDWGLMINENRLSLASQPWSVVLPTLAIAFLTIGTNLFSDGLARAASGVDRAR